MFNKFILWVRPCFEVFSSDHCCLVHSTSFIINFVDSQNFHVIPVCFPHNRRVVSHFSPENYHIICYFFCTLSYRARNLYFPLDGIWKYEAHHLDKSGVYQLPRWRYSALSALECMGYRYVSHLLSWGSTPLPLYVTPHYYRWRLEVNTCSLWRLPLNPSNSTYVQWDYASLEATVTDRLKWREMILFKLKTGKSLINWFVSQVL